MESPVTSDIEMSDNDANTTSDHNEAGMSILCNILNFLSDILQILNQGHLNTSEVVVHCALVAKIGFLRMRCMYLVFF